MMHDYMEWMTAVTDEEQRHDPLQKGMLQKSHWRHKGTAFDRQGICNFSRTYIIIHLHFCSAHDRNSAIRPQHFAWHLTAPPKCHSYTLYPKLDNAQPKT